MIILNGCHPQMFSQYGMEIGKNAKYLTKIVLMSGKQLAVQFAISITLLLICITLTIIITARTAAQEWMVNEMDDYISRQASLDAMDTWDKFGCDPDGRLVRYDEWRNVPYVHYEDMVNAIKNMPSADVQPVRHGYWEIYVISPFDGEDVRCSECGTSGCAPYWDYCPHCGARMDGAT